MSKGSHPMTDDFESFIDSLIEDELPATTRASKAQLFDCPQCGGSGKYRGVRVHQDRSDCFACRGTGKFKTDPRKLAQRRDAAKAKKLDAKARAVEIFEATHPGLMKFLGEAGSWSEFAGSLFHQIADRGSLSERQLSAALSMRAKVVAKQEAAEAAKRNPVSFAADLSPIKAMFDNAVCSGYKKPAYRAEGIVIKRAPDSGRNAGALYVTNEETSEYLGKVIDLKFFPVRGGEKAAETLQEIAKDPLAAAIRYGRRTGQCACCGRELTNGESIERGIGPICADKWGF